MKDLQAIARYLVVMALTYLPLALCYGWNSQTWPYGTRFVFISISLIIGMLFFVHSADSIIRKGK